MSALEILPNNQLKLKCSFDERELAKQIPDYVWNNNEKAWYYPYSEDRVTLFKKLFPMGTIKGEKTSEKREHSATEKHLIALKNIKECSIDIPQIKATLFNHQKIGINYLLNIDCAMLNDEMGVCKSLQAIGLSLIRKQNKQVEKCLIVCPATMKYLVWAKEIDKFTDEKYIVIDGDPKKRAEQYNNFFERKDIFYLIVNYENLEGDIAKLKLLPYNSICIADEIVYIKSRKAQRTKALRKIPVKYRIGITGYAHANRVEDLWSQFDWIYPKLLGTYNAFEDKYCEFFTIKKHHTEETRENGKACKCKICGKWSPEQRYAPAYTCSCEHPEWERPEFRKFNGYKNLDELKYILEPYYIRRLSKDVQDLPEKIYEEREVLLSDDLLKAYHDMKETMRLQITNMSGEEITAKANGILIQMLRLSQLTCGFITDKELDEHPKFFNKNPKVDALDEIIEESLSSNKKIVIWTRFRAFMAYLYKRYTTEFRYNNELLKVSYLWGGMSLQDKNANVNAFQTDPNRKIIIGTVQTGGMGIDLTAGSVEVFTDLSFLAPATILQAEKRLHRLNQKNPVVIIKLLAQDTVDEHWLKLLQSKQSTSDFIFGDNEVRINNKDTLLELLQ